MNLCPGIDAQAWLLSSKRSGTTTQLKNLLAERLPKRFADKFCPLALCSVRTAEVADNSLESIGQRLNSWQIVPVGTMDYGKAEVTRGGVDTHELSSTTMEATNVPGLYFIGEVVDVTGQLGGYNLHWAWSSGFAAGQCV